MKKKKKFCEMALITTTNEIAINYLKEKNAAKKGSKRLKKDVSHS